MQSRIDQTTSIAPSTTNRSAISNGSLFRKRQVDGRSAEGRRFRDLVEGYSAEIGKPNDRELALIRQAASLTVQSETMQARIVNGDDVDVEQVTRLANVLTRTLKELGLRKRRKEPKGLQAYLAGREAPAT